MSKSIGIDLGTTNSVAAIKKVHTEVLKNAEQELITPSAVTIKKKKIPFAKPEFVVGKHALEWLKQDPENTIVAIKRLMGRNYQDKEIREILTNHKLHYQIAQHSRGTENSIAIMLGGKEFTPEEISSEILKKIRSDAETSLNDTAEYAVITVPSYFNDKQKHATRTAAALAGLKVRRLLSEPTAAAISFGVDTIKGDDAQTVFIFDFGGGTLDISVLTISGGQFIEQGKGGDMWLGGEDIDQLISNYILKQTAEEYEIIEDMSQFINAQEEKRRNRFIGELRNKAEQAKIALTTQNEAHIDILGILQDSDGDSVDVDVELTRQEFDNLIAPTIERMIYLTRKMLEDIHFTPDLIDKILLVGGSSQIPGVKAAIEKEFGKEKVLIHERPMLAIAEGAAILSHRLSDTYECPNCGTEVRQADLVCQSCEFDLEAYTIEHGIFDIVHSAAHDYYIRLENNENYLFIEKNTPLPFEKTEVFKLVHQEQKLIHLKFYNMVNEQEESIGDLWLGVDIQKKEKKEIKGPFHVEITLKIDESNVIGVTAKLKEFPDVWLSKTLSRGKADEKLFLSLEETINQANQKKYDEYVMLDLTYRSLSAIRDIHKIVDEKTGTVDETTYEQALLKIEKAKKMSEEGKSGKSTIFYAQVVLRDYAPAIPPEIRTEIRKSVKHLEEMDEQGTYEENIKAIDDLNDVLNEKLGAVNFLMEIQKAGDFCMESNPSRAPKFYKYIHDILEAFGKEDREKAFSLLKEIMPETYEVVQSYEARSGVIYKDIKR